LARQPTATLPDPAFVAFPGVCPACAYDLAGAEKLKRCPECGLVIAVGSPCLAIGCVPKHKAGPVWRRLVWIAIMLVLVILSQTWFYIVTWQPWLLGVLLLGCIVAATLMIMTGTSVATSTEKVLFTPSGMIRSVWGESQSTFHPWDGTERCRCKGIGVAWQRLWILDDSNRVIFDCGFRCRTESLSAVAAAAERYARGEEPDRAEFAGLIEDRMQPGT